MGEQGFQAAAAVLSLDAVRAPADKGTRVAGYLIDVLPAIVLGLFGLIPIMGPIMAGLMLTPYWLLRDVTGSSLGKLILRTTGPILQLNSCVTGTKRFATIIFEYATASRQGSRHVSSAHRAR